MTTATVPALVPNRSLRRRLLGGALWTVQVVVGALFVMAGFMKATAPIAELAQQMGWPGALPAALVRFIGVAELAGGVGLILPALTRIKPMLTPLAGAGLALVMLLALVFHVARGEFGAVPFNAILGGLALFVAWGRFRSAPITPRR